MTDLGAYRAGLFSLTRRGFLKATAGWLTGLTAIGSLQLRAPSKLG